MAIFTLTNTTGVTFVDGGFIVPQTLNVYGLTGTIAGVQVTLGGLTHTFPDELDFLLVGPDGTSNLAFWSDGGGDADLFDVNVTVSDAAASAPPDSTSPVTGTSYRPVDYSPVEIDTNYGSTTGGINHPAGDGAVSFASVFGGLSSNGTWSLFAADDGIGDFGSLASWGVAIETADNIAAIAGTGAANTLTVDLAGGEQGSYRLDLLATVQFAQLPVLTFDGLGGTDSLVVTAPTAATFTIAGNTVFNGSTGITYTAVEAVQVTGSNGANDTFNVNGPTAAPTNLAGGAVVNFQAGANLAGGTIVGGVVTRLTYGGSAVAVNLGLGASGFSAELAADQEIPSNATAATATASITNYNIFTKTFDIAVNVSGLTPAEISGFHIHRAPVGANGSIFIDFMPGGVPIAPLVPTMTGFSFTATGVALPEGFEASLFGGLTYLNIHTPAFPGGQLRGQLFQTGNVAAASGTATGTGGISNIPWVIGGTLADSLVGGVGVNVIEGGGGDDVIVGGPNTDLLRGEGGNDVIAWNNGDGPDGIDGGADTDHVVVNGGFAADDVFTIGANGARIDFDPFNLDIGTVETLTVNGAGGADSFTVNNLSGVADLTTINLNGFSGGDTFTVRPSTTVTVNVNGHGGADTLNINALGGTMLAGSAFFNVFGTQFINVQGLNRVNLTNIGGAGLFVNGGNGGDVLIAGIETDPLYQLNNGPLVSFNGVSALTFKGGGGADALIEGPGSQTFTGDAGDDVFVYGMGGGADVFTDFVAGAGTDDQVELAPELGISTMTQVLALAIQQGADTVLNFGGGNTLTLQNVNKDKLDVDDFVGVFDAPMQADFNGNGIGDVLWRNDDGTVVQWLMDGAGSFLGRVLGVPAASLKIAETGDFNRDGQSDILLRHTDGTVRAWYLNAAGEVALDQVEGAPDNTWRIAETGDFNRDSRSDILWRNVDGTVVVWLMNETSGRITQTVAAPDNTWHINGTGDFNGDGRDDILWRNDDGTVTTWLMNETSSFTSRSLGGPEAAWRIEGVGDFNADNRADILWRNADGTVVMWLINAAGGFTTHLLAAPDNGWQIEDVAEFSGDNRDDILWRNTDGTVSTWTITANQSFGAFVVAGPEAAWHIQTDPTGVL